MNRRTFLKATTAGAASLLIGELLVDKANAFSAQQPRLKYRSIPNPIYENVEIGSVNWESLGDGMDFKRIPVIRKGELVDVVSALRLNPEQVGFRVFNTYGNSHSVQSYTADEWLKRAKGPANEELAGVWNSAQYMADPWGCPVAPIIQDGKIKGPHYNQMARGAFVAEPKNRELPKADIIDFDYSGFDVNSTLYKQAVVHWPIILDREKKIGVASTSWQANRTMMAKDTSGNIVVLVTEGGFFTLYNFGRFLRDSDLHIHTALNMDGGYEAQLAVRTPTFNYVTFGQFETYGPEHDATMPNVHYPVMGIVGCYRRSSTENTHSSQ